MSTMTGIDGALATIDSLRMRVMFWFVLWFTASSVVNREG